MAKSTRQLLHQITKILESRTLRPLVRSMAAWSRNQLGLLTLVALLIWFSGALALFLTERHVNPGYETPFDALWNVWLLLFSGLEDAPTTVPGRLLAMVLSIVGVGLVSFFTAVVASLLVEKYLRRREVTEFQMSDHLVLCNWAPRGLDWIREVHSRIIQQKRPVVIIHDRPEEIELPDKQDEAAFSDVYIVKGEPSNDVILRRAKVADAYSVVVLADDREGKHADGKTLITCVAIRAICKGDHQPNIAVECRNLANRSHLKRAGADEIISSDDLGLRMLARASLFHGMTRFYQELLTVGRDANEIYLLPAPEALVGTVFSELSGLFARYREDKRSCLIIGIQRGEEMMINPIGGEAGPLRADDQLILLSRVFPSQSLPLPTVGLEKVAD
ncbi:potassium channel family protein [Tundrisphaera sp. TA3]|uniref:potassium channel family protein n=1 Tax=Tundrisphaera sp. TA3 TaxID=3435775 RepID=UPI003EB9E607